MPAPYSSDLVGSAGGSMDSLDLTMCTPAPWWDEAAAAAEQPAAAEEGLTSEEEDPLPPWKSDPVSSAHAGGVLAAPARQPSGAQPASMSRAHVASPALACLPLPSHPKHTPLCFCGALQYWTPDPGHYPGCAGRGGMCVVLVACGRIARL